jgi:hypothetical protein
MFRSTGSAECVTCEQRNWERHCGARHCGWYVCRACGRTTDSRRAVSFRPGGEPDEQDERRTA